MTSQVKSVAAFCGLLLACGSGLAQPAVAPAASRLADNYPIATAVRVGGDEKQTRFVLDLSRRLDPRVFLLADPYRVVVDLPQVNFQLPLRAGDSGRGLVKAFRFGLVMAGGSRIVIDLTRPARVENSFVLDPSDGQPARFVIDLAAVDREAFERAVAVDARLARGSPTTSKHERDASGDPRPIIVLDPGHGGIDEGTHAPGGQAEKTVVLDFALVLRDKLERTGKYRVVMTRADDTFVPLADRVQVAHARKAQLFISIHCDALARGGGDAQGATIYTLSEQASDAEAARLAEKENRADVIAGVDLSNEPNDIADILIDLAQRETKAFSMQFAQALVTELKSSARLHKQPLKSAGFRVLKAADVPSVLIELGFVSNAANFKQIMSDPWRSRASDSMVQAINTYFTTRIAGASPLSGRN